MDKSNLLIDFASTNKISPDLENQIKDSNSRYYKLPQRNKFISYFFELSKICKKYDCIYVHSNSATATIELLTAKLSGVKQRIIHIHNSTCTHIRIHNMLKPFFFHSYTLAIACSGLAGEWAFGKKHPYYVLNNAIDVLKYRFSETVRFQVRRELSLENKLVIGHVGKFNKQKNHLFLLDVFREILKRNRDAKLLLVGDGELKENIENKISEQQLTNSVILVGMKTNVENYLQAMDVFVFPSLYEGMPLSVLEAQASGLECILSDSITKDVDITNKVIFMSLKKSAKDWSEVILSTNTKNRTESSSENIKKMKDKKFDINTNAKVLNQIIEKK